jgi:ribosomal-protein-alanine N-acetyltransferase
MNPLRTERLILRTWRDEDRDPWAAMNADPVVMEHFPGTLTRAEADACIDRYREHFEEHGYGLWAVEEAASGDFVGFVGLNNPTFEADFLPATEIGWRLAQHHWGKGYATEAARRALQFGFEEADLDEIQSWTVPANLKSIAVMERLGMTHDPADDFEHPKVPLGHPLRLHLRYRLSRWRWITVV